MSVSVYLPNEILYEIVDLLIHFPHDHGKAPWNEVEGITKASRRLRFIAMRSWCSVISIREADDWSYLAKRNVVCGHVREAHVMRFNAFVDLFHIFPLLNRVHLRFMSFSEHIGTKLHWIPKSIVELELALPDITDSFILSTLAERFKGLCSLKLIHSQAWRTPKTMEDVCENIRASDLNLLTQLKHLSLGILSVESDITNIPQDLNHEEVCSVHIANSIDSLESLEWTRWTSSGTKANKVRKIRFSRGYNREVRVRRARSKTSIGDTR